MLIDANLLLYAVDRRAKQHAIAKDWLTEQLNGSRPVGLPWQSLGAFLRISTHPRAFDRPLAPGDAWARVDDWIGAPAAWIPVPGDGHAAILAELVRRHAPAGNLVPDVMLAALALEHGLAIHSADTDFARFPEVRWVDPLGG